MRVAALISGGKDSLYAMHQAQQHGHDVVCICSVQPEAADSYMFHKPNTHLLPSIAETLNTPLLTEETAGEKEDELDDLHALLARAQQKYSIDGVVTGALASQYQKTRIDELCTDLGLESVAPLWQINEEALWDALLPEWRVMVTAVSAAGLSEEWLGRVIDQEAVDALQAVKQRHGIHLGGEGGEFETLVLDCPLYEKRIHVTESETEWDGMRGTHHITSHSLQPPSSK